MQTYEDKVVSCTAVEGKVLESSAEEFPDVIFLFLSELLLTVNKFVLIPDALVDAG